MFQSDLCKHKLKVLHLSLHTVAFCQISISFKCLFLTFNFLLESKNRYVPNFVCVLTNERYKTYRTGLSSYCLCQALGVGLGGGGSKGQISSTFNYKVNFNGFYTKLCVFSQINNIKHIEQNFHSMAWVMPQGWDLGGAGGVQNFSMEICDVAPIDCAF